MKEKTLVFLLLLLLLLLPYFLFACFYCLVAFSGKALIVRSCDCLTTLPLAFDF